MLHIGQPPLDLAPIPHRHLRSIPECRVRIQIRHDSVQLFQVFLCVSGSHGNLSPVNLPPGEVPSEPSLSSVPPPPPTPLVPLPLETPSKPRLLHHPLTPYDVIATPTSHAPCGGCGLLVGGDAGSTLCDLEGISELFVVDGLGGGDREVPAL